MNPATALITGITGQDASDLAGRLLDLGYRAARVTRRAISVSLAFSPVGLDRHVRDVTVSSRPRPSPVQPWLVAGGRPAGSVPWSGQGAGDAATVLSRS